MSAPAGILVVAFLGLCLAACGCASADGRLPDYSRQRMPFVLKITGRTAGASTPATAAGASQPTAMATLLDSRLLAEHLAACLDEMGLFSKVIVGASDPASTGSAAAAAAETRGLPPYDIELTVTAPPAYDPETQETYYGSGENRFWPCVLSTGMWLLLGPACWWVPEREYDPGSGGRTRAPPDARAEPGGAARAIPTASFAFTRLPGNENARMPFSISASKISVCFLERHDWRVAWLWNLIMPTWAGPLVFGIDREIADERFAQAFLDEIARGLPDRLLARIGERYPRNSPTGSYLFLSHPDNRGVLTVYLLTKVSLPVVQVDGTPWRLWSLPVDQVDKFISPDLSAAPRWYEYAYEFTFWRPPQQSVRITAWLPGAGAPFCSWTTPTSFTK
ncbi:MAG TPA: hypothetical protein DCM87_17235 [Planctomycetes bacterium]|nr:hypothetical protein [Planctomycetota bacterium]